MLQRPPRPVGFPFPAAGKIEKDGNGYAFMPV
jgi:uncharacterized protein (UPF0305 family)